MRGGLKASANADAYDQRSASIMERPGNRVELNGSSV